VETLILSCGAALASEPRSCLAAQRGRADAVLLQTAFLVDIADACRRWRCERVVGDANRRVVFAVEDEGEDPIIVDLAWRCRAHIERAAGSTAAERLRSVIDTEFVRGARAVAVVGSATPTLPAALIAHAFRALAWERCVLGPTFDGGLWLLGLQRGAPVTLPETGWSTPQTLALLATRLPEAPHLLPFWYDVDDAAAVERLVWHLRAARAHDPVVGSATGQALAHAGLLPLEPDRASTTAAVRPSSGER
jgi:glycosyltransferase A (GT-A) superfamily protein (DUF2064 family)